jgi:hypothetical protein
MVHLYPHKYNKWQQPTKQQELVVTNMELKVVVAELEKILWVAAEKLKTWVLLEEEE